LLLHFFLNLFGSGLLLLARTIPGLLLVSTRVVAAIQVAHTVVTFPKMKL